MTTDFEQRLSRRLHSEAEEMVPRGTVPPLRTTTGAAEHTRRGRPRWRLPLAAAAAVAAVVIVIAGIGLGADRHDATPAGPDVSTDGQVAYACALARDAKEQHGPTTSWTTATGNDTNPGFLEVAAAAKLLGAAWPDPPYDASLTDPAAQIYAGIARLDTATLQQGVDRLAAACDERGLPQTDLDTSADGRVAYACALGTDLRDHHGPVDTWRLGDGKGIDPAWFEYGGISGLLGTAFGMDHPPGHPELAGIGRGMFEPHQLGSDEAQQAFTGRMQRSIDELVTACHAE